MSGLGLISGPCLHWCLRRRPAAVFDAPSARKTKPAVVAWSGSVGSEPTSGVWGKPSKQRSQPDIDLSADALPHSLVSRVATLIQQGALRRGCALPFALRSTPRTTWFQRFALFTQAVPSRTAAPTPEWIKFAKPFTLFHRFREQGGRDSGHRTSVTGCLLRRPICC